MNNYPLNLAGSLCYGDGDDKMIRLALYLMRKRRRDEEEEQGRAANNS
jgi:hypothetical protein